MCICKGEFQKQFYFELTSNYVKDEIAMQNSNAFIVDLMIPTHLHIIGNQVCRHKNWSKHKHKIKNSSSWFFVLQKRIILSFYISVLH